MLAFRWLAQSGREFSWFYSPGFYNCYLTVIGMTFDKIQDGGLAEMCSLECFLD